MGPLRCLAQTLGLLMIISVQREVEAVFNTVIVNGANVCPTTTYYTQKYASSPCWEWDGYCTAYRTASAVSYTCCKGWTSLDMMFCNIALCRGVYAYLNPCNINVAAGQIIVNGQSQRSSGGTCSAPDQCTNCNLGFYGNAGCCNLCGQISNCDIETCISEWSSSCNRCASNRGSCKGCQAYRNEGTRCKMLCSWIPESNQCYPGDCGTNMFQTQCSCHQDFESPSQECRIFKTYPKINSPSAKLLDGPSGSTLKQNDPNNGSPEVIYAAPNDVRSIKVVFATEWRPTTGFPTRPAYVVDFVAGLAEATVTFAYNRVDYFYRNGDCGGHDLVSYASYTQEKCRDRCNERSDCKSFLFKSDWTYCWLKNYICSDSELTARGAANYALYNKMPCGDDCGYIYQNGDCNGRDLVNSVISLQKCREQCSQRSDCKSFQYNAGGTCYLKNYACSDNELVAVGSSASMFNKLPLESGKNIQGKLYSIVVGKNTEDIHQSGSHRSQCHYSGIRQDMVSCDFTVDIPDDLGFLPSHGGTLDVKISSKTGAKMTVLNKDNNQRTEESRYTPKESTKLVTYKFDQISPICTVTSIECVGIDVDVLTSGQGTFKVRWNQGSWTDSDSGLDRVEVDVMDMVYAGGELREQSIIFQKELSPVTQFYEFVPSRSGTYSVIFNMYDKAGNYGRARRLVFYDAGTSISIQGGTQLKVVDANAGWLTTEGNSVTLEYINRYTNLDVMTGSLLAAVSAYHDVDYDDTNQGRRTTNAVSTFNGITSFEIGYLIPGSGSVDYTTANRDRSQIVVRKYDGKTLRLYMRMTDFAGHQFTESTDVEVDTSPPIIRNLGITRDGKTGLAVHSVEDFTQMTFEWQAFDTHSGIKTATWVLFDNYTDIVTFGTQNVASNKFNSIAECGNSGSCYCGENEGVGCYNMDFSITPQIANGNGLNVDTTTGRHDADYFIGLEVENGAGLKSSYEIKITIDASPPHGGVVHDGFKMEIDYQQSLSLTAHWDGFFDRESGVVVYAYVYGTSCLDEQNFSYTTATSTKLREAQWTAPRPGTYYVSVVAYNRAWSPSVPVCSDGVVIDATRPVVSGLRMANIFGRPGLIKNDRNEVFYLQENGLRLTIINPSDDCVNKALLTTKAEQYALDLKSDGIVKTVNGTGSYCEDKNQLRPDFFMGLTKDTFIEAWWTGSDAESSIRYYEVALSSYPRGEEITGFEKSEKGTTAHYKKYHNGLQEGQQFTFLVRATNQAMLQKVQAFGPFVVDIVHPTYTGMIIPYMDAATLMVAYDKSAFEDGVDANALSIEYAVGTSKGDVDVVTWSALVENMPCRPLTSSPDCAVIRMVNAGWDFVKGKSYYVSLRATNFIGRSVVATADPLTNFGDKPSQGVVMEIESQTAVTKVELPEIFKTNWARFKEDIDFQTQHFMVSVWWHGFERPLHTTNYRVGLGSSPGMDDVVSFTSVIENATRYEFEHLDLENFKRYYTTVIATNENGETRLTTDGLTILEKGLAVDIQIKDGRPCDHTFGNITCLDEVDFQVSPSVLSARWDIPAHVKPFITTAHWGIEENTYPEETLLGWTEFEPFLDLKMTNHIIRPGLAMVGGRRYRSVVKFCYWEVCFDPVYSNGVLIQSSPPVPGSMEVHMVSIGDGNGNNADLLLVKFERFEDMDIPDIYPDIAMSVVTNYEWSISSDGPARSVDKWTTANVTIDNDNNKLAEFAIHLKDEYGRLNPCPRVGIRGHTKALLSNAVYAITMGCEVPKVEQKVFDVLVDPAVKDGKVLLHTGTPIISNSHAALKQIDEDFTPYTNILSATFPKLPKSVYEYSVLHDQVNELSSNDEPEDHEFRDPCLLPMAIHCGKTDGENLFVNIEFKKGDLQHGQKYVICLFARNTTTSDTITEAYRDELYECTDGITVDITAPKAGRAWVGFDRPLDYLTTSNELFISWIPFDDEEEQTAGIKYYEYGIGSHYAEEDVRDWVNVGVTNHVRILDVLLQNGHEYYVTVRGTNHAGLSSESTTKAILVDRTPPTTTKQGIHMSGNFLTSTEAITAVWEDIFIDDESYVSYYEWAVGSQEGYADIMPYTKTEQEFGEYPDESSSESEPLKLQEGHAYYVSVRAYNGAGLSTLVNSWPTVVDASPPISGRVYDGQARKDADYQTDRHSISASWEGFADPHSGIVSYKWSVGSCSGCADKVEDHPVGIMKSARAENLELWPGQIYYVTVEACNGAGMCTEATSNGIIMDDSPPIVGVVSDGSDPEDSNFQSSRKRLAAKWWGFEDPQSGIKHYSWWAGITPGGDEIFSEERLHHFEEAYRTDFPTATGDLVSNEKIYITVKATNNAGLTASASSNGIVVDITPPEFKQRPQHRKDMGSVYLGTQVFKTLLRVTWDVKDYESHITEQYISISTHANGQIPAPTKLIEGDLLEHTFVGLDLDDGNNYYVTVHACNLAKSCATSTSDGILVDHSPPTTGMFAIDINSESSVSRQLEESTMRWTQNSLTLGWLGFSDVHSDIKYYELTVGSNFEGWDLSDNKIVTVNHCTVNCEIQKKVISTRSRLIDDKHIYVSIVAVNKAGLRSPVLNKKFVLIDGGEMDLVRRCDPETCMGDCVCAKEGERCPAGRETCNAHRIRGYTHRRGNCPGNEISKFGNQPLEECIKLCDASVQCRTFFYASDTRTCSLKNAVCSSPDSQDINTYHTYTKKEFAVKYELLDTVGLAPKDQDQTSRKYSPSKCMLAAKWRVLIHGDEPIRYEFSAGVASQDEPSGIFDPSKELVWHDVGKASRNILTLNPEKYLSSGVKYKIFLQAWTSDSEFEVLTSDGVIQDDLPPALGKQQAAEVKDCAVDKTGRPVDKYINKDMDYTTNSRYLCTSWKHRFQEDSDDAFNSFFLSISSYPGGGDVRYYEKYADPTSTFKATKLKNVQLESGYRYYSNVIAYNNAGLCTMSYSDGFVLDQNPPKTGIVYDGDGLHDAEYQKNTDVMGAHWNGFVDLESYIDHYLWCIGLTNTADECDAMPWTNVGLKTRVRANIAADHGKEYFNKVIAVDAAGHRSTAVVTDGVIVDGTRPVVVSKLQFGENLLKNPSFEEDSGRTGTLYYNEKVPKKWVAEHEDTTVAVLGYTKLATDGQKLVILFGGLKQSVYNLIIGEKYRVIVHASEIYPSPSPNLVQHGRIVLPDGKEYIFQLHKRASRPDVNGDEMQAFWRSYSFYFHATSTSGDFIIASVGDNNAVLFDAISIRETQEDGWTPKRVLSDNHPLSVLGIYTKDWNGVRVAWDFHDDESPIVDYTWAIGLKKGDVQLQGFTSVGRDSFGESGRLELEHTSVIFVTIIATNAAGLKAVYLSDEITLDLTPPVFEYVKDSGSGEDVDYQTSMIIKAHWNVTDPESGIEFCQCGLGSHEYVTDVLKPVNLPPGQFHFEFNLNQPMANPSNIYTIGDKIFVTVRCFNLAGEEATATSDGVVVEQERPHVDNAEVTITTPSLTQFPSHVPFRASKDRIDFSWSGFQDGFRVAQYALSFHGVNVWAGKSSKELASDLTSATVRGLDMSDNVEYSLYVNARNGAGRESDRVPSSFIIDSQEPRINNASRVSARWVVVNQTIVFSWSGVFGSNSPLVYEISVGSLRYGADIIQWQESTEDSIDLFWSKPVNRLYVTITAINSAGLYKTVSWGVERPISPVIQQGVLHMRCNAV